MVIYMFLRPSYSQSWRKDKGAVVISVLLPIDNFFFFFFSFRHTQICTFDLWPPRCWLQAAAASLKTPLRLLATREQRLQKQHKKYKTVASLG